MTMMNNPLMLLQQFKANPLQFIMQRGFNVPVNVGNNPQAILNHLVQSGQITQEQINSAYQMAQRFR